jgi:hypothetical protein
MPKKHTIAVSPDGVLEFTRNTELSQALAPLGDMDMERVTDICKFKTSNEYYIKWLLGPFKYLAQTHLMGIEYGVELPKGVTKAALNVLSFASYEDAVAYEIEMLAAMRRAGVSFAPEIEQTRTDNAAATDSKRSHIGEYHSR